MDEPKTNNPPSLRVPCLSDVTQEPIKPDSAENLLLGKNPSKTTKLPTWVKTNHLMAYNNEIRKMRHWLCLNQEELRRDNKALYDNYFSILFTPEANRLQNLINCISSPQNPLMKRTLQWAVEYFIIRLRVTQTHVDDSEWCQRQLPPSAYEPELCLIYPAETIDASEFI